jgi:glucose/arabinose dehydrogenase
MGLILPQYSPTYSYSIEEAFPNLTFDAPVGIYSPRDGNNFLYVVEQNGKIQIFEDSNETTQKFVFLDITDKVISGGERGLLGLAFHPNFSTNGKFYIDYTKSPSGNTIISEFRLNLTNSMYANESSERVLLEIAQPFSNHNGGQIAFGEDGYLYIGLGDGGSANDPLGNGQDRTTLLGSILRIDVEKGDP